MLAFVVVESWQSRMVITVHHQPTQGMLLSSAGTLNRWSAQRQAIVRSLLAAQWVAAASNRQLPCSPG